MATTDLRALILKKGSEFPRREVYVPEWDLTVWVKMLSAGERDAYEDDSLKRQGKGRKTEYVASLRDHRARLLVRVLVDEAGERIFSNADMGLLSNMPVAPIQRLYNVAIELNEISEEDEEELLGNSGTAPAEPSSTA